MRRRNLSVILIWLLAAVLLYSGARQALDCAPKQTACAASEIRDVEESPVFTTRKPVIYLEETLQNLQRLDTSEAQQTGRRPGAADRALRIRLPEMCSGIAGLPAGVPDLSRTEHTTRAQCAIISYIYHQNRLG